MLHLEDMEQMAVMQWARVQRIPGTTHKVADFLIAIPNEGQRSPRTGQKFKKLGLKPGVSDLFLAYPVTTMHGCWIEMKKCRKDYRCKSEAENAATEHQKDWLLLMGQQGYFQRLAYGADEAIDAIKTYLGVQ